MIGRSIGGSRYLGGEHQKSESDKLTDNRKVVVEDLVYIDDLEILIYITISPKSSTIFVTYTKRASSQPKELEVVTLSTINKKHPSQPVLKAGDD